MREFGGNVAQQIEGLPSLGVEKLRSIWVSEFGRPPRFRAQKELLALILAYRLQAKAYGGLHPVTRKRLRNLAEAFGKAGDASPRIALRPKPGTRLIREWRGATHVVSVLDGEIEYRGKRYGSLSEVARVITGTRWSGPVFFGLKPRTAVPETRAKSGEH